MGNPSQGAELRAARKKAGLTQQELAKKLRMDRSQVSRYETGQWDPNTALLRRWARACETTARALVLG